MNGAFEIDSIELWPQPDVHTWSPEQSQIIGYDGNGAPIKRKYRNCSLTLERSMDGQNNWSDFDDGATHTFTSPAPGTVDGWADYTGCYVVYSHGQVDDAEAMKQISLMIRRAVA